MYKNNTGPISYKVFQVQINCSAQLQQLPITITLYQKNMQIATACISKSLVAFLLFASWACQKPLVKEPPGISPVESKTAIAAAATASATAICDYNLDEAQLKAAGWTKTFEDDFSGTLTKWNIWNGGAYNNEWQLYQPQNLQVSDGNLAIAAVKQTATGPTTPFDATPKTFHYTSGRIECKTNVSAGVKTPKVRMAARIKLPAGYGLWPAFWSYGDPWPTQGEIDILEARGQEPTKYLTNYFYGPKANNNLVRNAEGYINANMDLTQCYHVYEMIWEKNTLSAYLDGVLVEVKSGDYIPRMFGKTQRITLNLAVGGNFFSNLDPAQVQEGTMYVDWVKVFTSR
jgi:beta-glucanase (GH16 family)